MNIPSSFYVKTWISNLFSFAMTGSVLSIFIGSIPAIPIGAIAGLALGFVKTIAYTDNADGKFEFQYRINLINKKTQRMVFRYLGFFNFLLYWQDNLNGMETVQSGICKDLLKLEKISTNPEKCFPINMKLSFLALKNGDFNVEKEWLKKALELNGLNIIANFNYAVTLELDGEVDAAIEYFEKALSDPNIHSDSLKFHIESQITRIKNRGPRNRAVFSGLKYASY